MFSDQPRVEDGEAIRIRDNWPCRGVYVLEQMWTALGIDKRLLGQARSKKTPAGFYARAS